MYQMKTSLKLLILAVIAASATLSAKPSIKLIRSGIVCDSLVDATSPSSMAIAPDGSYLLCFQNRGDCGPGAFTYITRSKDHGKTWSKPETFVTPEDDYCGALGSLMNIPGRTDIMLALKSTIRHETISRNPYEFARKRKNRIDLFTTTDGITLTPLATLKQPKDSLVSPMGSLTQLANGDIILSAYIYRFGHPADPEGTYGCGWYRSTDGGKTWGDFEVVFKDKISNGVGIDYAFTESAFAVHDDGTITGFVRTDRKDPRRQFMVVSKDNGKTWTDPVDAGRLIVYFPLMAKLADKQGFLMVGGWRQAYRNCVSMLYSKDGYDFELIGQAAYQPDNKPIPMNSATGGVQAMVPGPKKHQYYVVFYTHDPKLPGHDKLRIEGNMFEFVPDKK